MHVDILMKINNYTANVIAAAVVFFVFSMFLLIMVVGDMRFFDRLGISGWIRFVPFYGSFRVFQAVYGSGRRLFLMLIPIYGIFVLWQLRRQQACILGRSKIFGVGMFFLPHIFIPIAVFLGV